FTLVIARTYFCVCLFSDFRFCIVLFTEGVVLIQKKAFRLRENSVKLDRMHLLYEGMMTMCLKIHQYTHSV
ncbi:hypothetical protein, partial [Klebsiella variicola]|uniref:hypothetical protein n=1 Tax=Klebsiella variicola TaxID=244366 RepID=UPI002731D960